MKQNRYCFFRSHLTPVGKTLFCRTVNLVRFALYNHVSNNHGKIENLDSRSQNNGVKTKFPAMLDRFVSYLGAFRKRAFAKSKRPNKRKRGLGSPQGGDKYLSRHVTSSITPFPGQKRRYTSRNPVSDNKLFDAHMVRPETDITLFVDKLMAPTN